MTEAINTNATETTTAEKPKLTRQEKLTNRYNMLLKRIESDTAEANDLAAELNTAAALASIGEGSAVQVRLGKGETLRWVAGTVVAVKDEEDGARLYKVQHGTGFDTDVAVVRAASIRLPEAVQVEAAPAEAAQA